MEEADLDITFQSELIGREEKFKKLVDRFDRAKGGDGSTVFVAGEAGIGKTRLVDELLDFAEDEGAEIIRGRCLTDSLEPLTPFKDGLREADLYHLISEEPPPKVLAAYLINDAGMLVAKAEREQDTDIDSDAFSSMLKAVQGFVKDSLSMMGRDETGELNSIGYGDYKILIQSLEGISLATVIEGSKSEFLIDDMKEKLAGKAEELEDWVGDALEDKDIRSEMQWFIDSGKYDGEFLVDDPKLKQENLFDNILLGLERLSSEQPVLLFLDDLHWTDPTSLKLIHYLSRNTKDDKVLILGTYRPEDIEIYDGETHQLKTTMQKMNREGLFEKIELERLDEADVEEFIEKTLDKIELDDEFVKKLYEECEGNPFFLLELLRNLLEEGHLVREEEVWKVERTLEEVPIPARVYDLVVRRLDRLKEEQRELLECASVMGVEFESDVLGKVAGRDRVELLKDLNEIERTHNLVSSLKEKYRFGHSKIREVLYEGLNEELQREYHRVVGESYEELYKEDEEAAVGKIGQHYYKANDERAGEYLLKAGDHARKRHANEEAERFYGYAIEILEEEDELKEAYEALGNVHELMGKYNDALKEYERALDLVEGTGEEARFYGKMAEIYEEKGEFDKSLDICEKGLDHIEQDIPGSISAEDKLRLLDVKGWSFLRKGKYDRAEEAWREGMEMAEEAGDEKEIAQALHDIGTLYFRRGTYDKAVELLDEGLQIREDLGDEKGLVSSLNNIGVVYQNKGELDRSLENFEESLDISRKIDDKRGTSMSLNNIGMVYRDKGELDRGLEYYKKSLEIDRRLGDEPGIGMSLNNIGEIYRDKGDLDRSLEHFKESLEIKRELGDKRGLVMSLNNIGEVYREKGELDRSLEHFKESLEISRELGDKRGIAESLKNIAKVYRHKGQIRTSREHIDESLDICLDIGSKRLSIENLCELAETCMEQGKDDTALQKAERAVELSTEMGTKPEIGKSRRVMGMVYRKEGELERAEKEFKEAEKSFEDSGLKKDLPKVIYEHALLFLRSEEMKKAEEYLEEAFASFRKRGMELWSEKCEEKLKDLDVEKNT
ncbi:MAG: tetratricopeptide repeat protein [Candidatus Thermoplasmatota archaeon]|nr:tetratricopeptide repeat protein [Candidatus Thermoplasmatota archaeon]